jgi:hypothetical protein
MWHTYPLLGNDRQTYETTAAARQWPAQQWTCCWKWCFLRGPLRGYVTQPIEFSSVREESRVEAGSNTSTVALRVVGGDEKGSLESERRAPAAIVNDRPVLSSQRATQINKPTTVSQQ